MFIDLKEILILFLLCFLSSALMLTTFAETVNAVAEILISFREMLIAFSEILISFNVAGCFSVSILYFPMISIRFSIRDDCFFIWALPFFLSVVYFLTVSIRFFTAIVCFCAIDVSFLGRDKRFLTWDERFCCSFLYFCTALTVCCAPNNLMYAATSSWIVLRDYKSRRAIFKELVDDLYWDRVRNKRL